MERRLISSGSPYEGKVGYSRAVVAGSHVFVSGTTARMPDGSDPPPDAYVQARRCLEIISEALAEAGATPRDVVRTRVFLARASDIDGVGRAHAEVFAEVRPANTTVVAELLDPSWLVEIEVDALVGERAEPRA